MFNYLFWPNNWGGEITNQLRNVKNQVQIITDSFEFEKMENELFKIQNKGVLIELVIYLSASDRTMKKMNILKRMSIAGSKISIITTINLEKNHEFLAILDRREIISNKSYEGVENIGELIYQKVHEFQLLTEKSDKVNHAVDKLKIVFQSNCTDIRPGDTVQLYWEVDNADFIELEPSIGSVKSKGSITVPVFEDTHFRLKASNRSDMLIKSLFVKILDDAFMQVQVSVYDPKNDNFIVLESANNPDHSYAVFKLDKVKMVWSTLATGILFEQKLGFVESYGEHIFQIFGDENYIFTLQTTMGKYSKKVNLFTIEDQIVNPDESLTNETISEVELPKIPLSNIDKIKIWIQKIMKWFKRK